MSKQEKINMKRIIGFLFTIFLVIGITVTGFAQQDDMMMSKKTTSKQETMRSKKPAIVKHRKNSKHRKQHRKGKMVKKSTMK